MLGRLAALNNRKIPRAGTEFPYDSVIDGEPEVDPRPLELTVKARGLVFRDRTAVGGRILGQRNPRGQKAGGQQFATELKMLAQIAHLGVAKAILKDDPDPSLKGAGQNGHHSSTAALPSSSR